MRNSLLFPDPILTANVYAEGLLDDLLLRAIMPFWRDMQKLQGESYLWTVRYSRRGEHLKVRIHGPNESRLQLQQLFAKYVEEYLAQVQDQNLAVSRVNREDVPAIDTDDVGPIAEDRSFIWSTYRRSPVSLPASPWLDDDLLAAHVCRCLARGCELLFSALDAGMTTSRASQQKLLMKCLLSSLRALGLAESSQAADYFTYHRGWLLRFFVDDAAKEEYVLRQFEEQSRRTPASLLQIRTLAKALWNSTTSASAWERDMEEFGDYLNGFRHRAGYLVDPFTSNVTFAPVFKVFHGLANQIGLRPLDEAQTHHLLAAALASDEISLAETLPANGISS